jgi:hypothetical protein
VSCMLSFILLLVPLGHSFDGDVPSGFPVNECDCLVEFSGAGEILDFIGSKELVPVLLANLVGLEPGASAQMRTMLKDPRVSSLLVDRSVLGMQVHGELNDFEWIAWVPIQNGSITQIISDLKPVRNVDRLVIPRLNISVARCGDGMLLASEPPGSLRTQALAMIGRGFESLPWADEDAPLKVTFTNDDLGRGLWFGQPGASRFALRMNEEDLQVSYSGWARDGMPKKPCCERLLDLAVLERMPKDVIGVFVELPDTELMPGTVFLQDLLPYVVDPERSDERWSRRMVVLGEMSSTEGLTVPTLAIAIESDGPGSTLRRQDISVLAALNSLRNRLGSKAGLQHLPKLQELPETGPRTIYARALFEPTLAGHPFLKDFSINWCRAKGVTEWELYATCPNLTSQLSGFFEDLPGDTQCVSASHVGRINSRKLSEHFLSLIAMAPEFVNALELPGFKAGVSLLYELVRRTEVIDWVVSIPDNGRVDATITLRPKRESGGSVE